MPASPSIAFVLRRRFDAIRARNPAFSLRAYARKLDMPPAALCEILQGKRTVTAKLAAHLAAGADFDEAEREQILSLARQTKRLQKARRKKPAAASVVLELDQYFLVSEWYYYAILSLAETRGFRATPAYLAKRLGLSLALAESALERLVRLGYFAPNSRGRLELKPGVRLSTSNDVANASLQRRHGENLEAAQTALRECPVEEREFTFITMAIDPAKLPMAKALLREFRDKVCAFLEDGKQSEVYEFCLSLFPRTVRETKEPT